MTSSAPRNAHNGVDLSKSPSHLLRRCVQYANDLFSREPGVSNLTKQQFTVLAAVEQNEGINQTDLVAITGIDRSTIAEMIRRMIEKNLLDRERTESDKRANALHLAGGGRKALRGARTACHQVERMLLSGLSATDRVKLVEMLTVIAREADMGEPRTKIDFRRIPRVSRVRPVSRALSYENS